MDIAPFVPVVVEATKFMFGEISKLIEHARHRSGKNMTALPEVEKTDSPTGKLTKQDFEALQSDLSVFALNINLHVAEANAYTISGLVAQLKIHYKNLVDLETTEAEFGPLTPQHIKRGIERESKSIIEKSSHLKLLLEQVHNKRIELP